MNKRFNSFHKKTSIVVVCCLMLISCSSQFAANVRKVTYPPDFKYTEPAALQSDMGKLAQQMRLLDQALDTQHNNTVGAIEEQRQQVLTALQKMSKIAANLNAGNAGANHPFMQDYMQDFVAKVDQAKVAASLAQPRYYFAGKVSGACTSCHKVNR